MRNRLLLFSLLVFLPALLHAQTGFYEPGYIVQNGDTIQGFIDRNDEITMSTSVSFKTEIQVTDPVVYSPHTLTGFGFRKDNLYFGAVEVEIRRGSEVSHDSRFAKMLLKGYVNLYKVQLPPGEQSVIYLTDNTFVYVIRKEGKDYTLGQYEYRSDNAVSINKRYIGVLNAILTGCPATARTFDQLKFEDKEMVRAVGAYNICIRPDVPTSHYAYEVKAVVKHGPEVSYGKFISTNTRLVTSSHAVAIGYFLDILKPDISRRHSTRLGLNYFYTHYKSMPRNRELETDMHFLRIPLLAQFNLAKSADAYFSPFVNVGMTGQVVTTARLINTDIHAYFSGGAGFYTPRYRFSFQLDSASLSLRSIKIVNFGIGYRLDGNKS